MSDDMEKQFQERIARAKEAARLASIAALARPPVGASAVSSAPVAVPPPSSPLARPADPPDDVRHGIDRLVEFIARNGPVFEETARTRERENPEFAFLHAGAPFHDYFVWRKSQLCASHAGSAPRDSQLHDPVMNVSVGAMANACKIARSRGLPSYSPLPPDLLTPTSAVGPPMEPARLETRLAEFYRS